MRLLHTSDWHLGRSFHRLDLLGAQAAYVDHLVETVLTERVDVVLVAGDVYDRALPSVDAVALCDDAFSRLTAAGAHVVVISGNHDSAIRLGFGSRLLASAGLHVAGDVRRAGTPVVLDDPGGPVAIYPIPYLEPDTARHALGEPALQGHTGVLGAALGRARDDLAGRAARPIVVAHAFVAGGAASESEREISVGGVASVSPALFAGFDYVALGHLHGPQVLGHQLRYSGSPLAYSFSEAAHRKGSWLVDLEPSGAVTVEFVEAPVPRRLATLRGTLEALLESREYESFASYLLSVVLTDPARPVDAMSRLQRRFPHVVAVAWEPQGSCRDGLPSYSARVRGRDDAEIAEAFVGHVRGTAANQSERELLRAALGRAESAAEKVAC